MGDVPEPLGDGMDLLFVEVVVAVTSLRGRDEFLYRIDGVAGFTVRPSGRNQTRLREKE